MDNFEKTLYDIIKGVFGKGFNDKTLGDYVKDQAPKLKEIAKEFCVN